MTQGGGSGHTVTARPSTTTYDADGNSVTVTDALQNATSTAYDADDQPVLVTDADQNATLTCYDGDGHLVQTIPPVGVGAAAVSRPLPAPLPTRPGTAAAWRRTPQ